MQGAYSAQCRRSARSDELLQTTFLLVTDSKTLYRSEMSRSYRALPLPCSRGRLRDLRPHCLSKGKIIRNATVELAGEGAPNARRCQRHLHLFGTAALTGVIERLDHRVDDGRRRADRAELSNAFHAEQVRPARNRRVEVGFDTSSSRCRRGAVRSSENSR